MKIYADYKEFKTVDRAFRADFEKMSDKFISHFKDGLNFFHTEGNHNIQIVNDLLDTASAGRLQRNRIVDWSAALVGHEVVKVAGGRYGFGKKLEDSDYTQIVENAPDYFSLYPDWYAYKPESKPETFEPDVASVKFKKYLDKLAKDASSNGYDVMADLVTKFKKEFEVAPVLTHTEAANDEEAPAAAAAA